jgi:acetylornithine deacetylase/succinyl-diaminopimelate desuccinylase-like protein
MKEILAYINKNKKRYVDELVELLKFPSVSADPARKGDVERCAEWVKAKLNGMDLETEMIQTAGHPIVYGEYMKPENSKTLIIYGHYDVQPEDPIELWDSPPFEPRIEGDTVYARGACDDKGQFMVHVLAVEAMLKTQGSLPVNVKFLIEGEEETAADNLALFIKDNHEKLKADGVVVSDTGMYAKNKPAITYGLRGIAVAEIRVSGPGKDLHSGSFGGGVANPCTELSRIIAKLHDSRYRIKIDGFYDTVRPLEDWEREMFKSLPFSKKGYLETTGSPAVIGEKGFTTLERVWGRPTCEVNGVYGGYQGEASKTIVPSWAGCKITMRLVPDQDPEDILKKFEAYVHKIASPAVKVEVKTSGGAKPAIVSRESFLVQAGAEAMEKGFGKAPVFIREGGSIPIVIDFKEELGLDTLLLGLAQNDDNAHSPNEKFSLKNYHKGIITSAHLLEGLR